MTPISIDPPSGFGPFELAEWVEAYIQLNGLASISRSAIAASFPAGQAPDAAELDEFFAEIRRRASAAPNLYPYSTNDDLIETRNDVDATAYDFLVILSIEAAPYRTGNGFNEVSPWLELLGREALLQYMGGGKAVRFGWPAGDGRPEHLVDAIPWLAKLLELPVGNISEIDLDDKDGGVDVVGWRPFADHQPSFAVYLVQVTVQATYERKGRDVNSEAWLAWILFGKPPVSALAIPYAIPPEAKSWIQLKRQVNLVLDRVRIVEMVDPRDLASFPEHADMRA